VNKDYNKNCDNATSNLLEIRAVRANPFYILIKKRDYQIFAVTIKNVEKTLKPKLYINSRSLVPEEYHDLIDIFKKRFINKLPPYRDKYNFKIKFEPDEISKFNSLYNISLEKLLIIRQYLDKYLMKEFIYFNRSLFTSPILFVKKSKKNLRFYVNYRVLNIITIRNRYPISLL